MNASQQGTKQWAELVHSLRLDHRLKLQEIEEELTKNLVEVASLNRRQEKIPENTRDGILDLILLRLAAREAFFPDPDEIMAIRYTDFNGPLERLSLVRDDIPTPDNFSEDNLRRLKDIIRHREYGQQEYRALEWSGAEPYASLKVILTTIGGFFPDTANRTPCRVEGLFGPDNAKLLLQETPYKELLFRQDPATLSHDPR